MLKLQFFVVYTGMGDLQREWNDLEAAGCDVQKAIAGMKLWRNLTDQVTGNWMPPTGHKPSL